MRLFTHILIILVICSCSSLKPRKKYTNKTASKMIVDYKLEGQKRELSAILSGKDVKKPDFLNKPKTDEYQMWLNYFTTSGKQGLITHMKNGERYREMIEKTLEEHFLPKELYFVGLIESGYELSARSHASAVGPWQFMPDTARRYSLKVSRSVDERRHIIKSTHAAARYFQDLYNIFGNWELALSAYNAGEFGVIRRIREHKTRSFYKLSENKSLPKETRNYVPKIKAVMEVYNNPHKYGITIPSIAPFKEETLKKYTIKSRASVTSIARKLGISRSQLLSLNPDLLHRDIPRYRKGIDIYVPSHIRGKSYTKTYSNRSVATSSRRTSNKVHIVKPGDNIIAIAKKYRVWVKDIIALNSINKNRIYPNQKLKIPRSPYDKKYHVVRPGEYLLKIAKKYGTSIRKIKRANSMDNSKIFPGQKLIVSL